MKNAVYFIQFLSGFLIAYLLYIRFRLIFSYNIDLDGAEYVFVHYVQYLLQGRNLYGNPIQFPFIPDIYTPGYAYLLYYIARIFKWHYINNIHEILVAARAIAFVFMLINLGFVYKCLKDIRVLNTCILPLMALYVVLITGHFYAMRPDAIKTTLFTIILYCLLRYFFFNGSGIYLLWFNVAVVLSVLFKHDAIINIMLVSSIFWVLLRNKKATAVLLSGVLSTAMVLGILYWVFGQYFFTNIVIINCQQITDIIHSYNLQVMLFSAARLMPLIALACYTCWLIIRKRYDVNAGYYIPFVAVACFIVAHASMLRAGSYLNYSFEPSFLLILNLGLLITAFEATFIKYWKVSLAAAGIYLLLLFGGNEIIHSYTFNPPEEDNYRREYFSLLQQRKDLIAIVGDKTIFFPNSIYMDYYADCRQIFGHDFHMDRFIELYLGLHVTSRQVFISSDAYDRYFETGQVPYIVVADDERSANHIRKYYAHYKYYRGVNNFSIYQYAM